VLAREIGRVASDAAHIPATWGDSARGRPSRLSRVRRASCCTGLGSLARRRASKAEVRHQFGEALEDRGTEFGVKVADGTPRVMYDTGEYPGGPRYGRPLPSRSSAWLKSGIRDAHFGRMAQGGAVRPARARLSWLTGPVEELVAPVGIGC
jgi:hypothetical protein